MKIIALHYTPETTHELIYAQDAAGSLYWHNTAQPDAEWTLIELPKLPQIPPPRAAQSENRAIIRADIHAIMDADLEDLRATLAGEERTSESYAKHRGTSMLAIVESLILNLRALK